MGKYWNTGIIQKDTCTPIFKAAQFTIAKTWKRPKCPSTDEWMRTTWYIHTMGCYSAIKNNEIMPFAATWMDLEMIVLSKISQTEKDNTMRYHLHVETKKMIPMNLFIKQKQTHRHRKESFGYQRGREMERDKLRIWA